MNSNKTIKKPIILISLLLAALFAIYFIWVSDVNLSALLIQDSSSPIIDQDQENFTRAANIPVLPFPDNPDPDQCGIPVEWGDKSQAWLNGYYEGELIEPVVHLYDSHLRLNIAAQAPHGSEVDIILYQSNPVLDYYLVKIKGQTGDGSEGWVPAPLLSFDPIE